MKLFPLPKLISNFKVIPIEVNEILNFGGLIVISKSLKMYLYFN